MVDVLSAFVSALLQVLLDRLASRQLLELFRRNTSAAEAAEKLKLQLLSVNRVLDDAEEKQIFNPYVKIWVDELREAVYHAQDLLDQIATDMVSKSHSAMDRVSGITSKLNSNLDEINSRIQVLRDQKDCLGLRERPQNWSHSVSTDVLYAPTTRIVDQSTVRGRDDDKREIIRRTSAAMGEQVKPVCVVAIVGMAGVGKTTLSQLLFNDPLVKQRFDTLSWVQVSGGSDVLQLTKKVCGSMNVSVNGSLDTLQVYLNKKLRTRRLLLVLDDFWAVNFFDWDLFKMAFVNATRGSVILVTTRNEDVATTMHAAVTYFLPLLLDEDCWGIFAHYAFGDRSPDTVDPVLLEIGKKIVKKCNGLPLAAKVLGSLLHSVADAWEWNDILQSKMWDLPANKSNILPALRLSYQLLPSHLKACFAYCSLFPKGYDIDKTNLFHLWMAEGLLQPSKTKAMHKVGEEYLQELLSRSLLQQSTNNDSCVIMHDLISELAQYVGGEFFYFLEEGIDQKIPEKVRHLSFSKDKLDVPQRYLSQLRTFLPFRDSNSRQLGSLIDEDFNSVIPIFECIRVLSLSSYPITTLPTTIGNLKHLRYLNLSCTMIQQLPTSVGCLYNLQILLLSNCVHLTSLPNNMENLTDLCHLDLTSAPLQEMPPNFGKLELLQHLTSFVVGRDTGSRISELGALSQLHGSLSIVNLQNVIDIDALRANLKGKTFLDELVFKWANDIHNLNNEAVVLHNLRPHKNLKRLEIKNYGGKTFPNWLGDPSISNLMSLHLTGCINCLTLPPLGQLSSLKTLLIEKMTLLEEVGPEFYGNTNSPFRALEILTFKNMHKWKNWWPVDVEEYFTSLKELCLWNCPILTGDLPRHFCSLNKLVVAKCTKLQLFPPGHAPHHYQAIEHLYLEASCELLEAFPLSSFRSLCDLHIQDCPNLQSLWISDEFTEELLYLTKIQLKNCCGLASFPNGGLPTPNLQKLYICNCENLSPCVGWGLREMASLVYFEIEGKLIGLESFPDRGLLPACLTDLHIMGLESLTSLNHAGLQDLVSLKNLMIQGCGMLVSLPPEGLPGSLSNLGIMNCPLLVPLCQSETGNYWPLIAHIPNKTIV